MSAGRLKVLVLVAAVLGLGLVANQLASQPDSPALDRALQLERDGHCGAANAVVAKRLPQVQKALRGASSWTLYPEQLRREAAELAAIRERCR